MNDKVKNSHTKSLKDFRWYNAQNFSNFRRGFIFFVLEDIVAKIIEDQLQPQHRRQAFYWAFAVAYLMYEHFLYPSVYWCL